MNEPTPTPGSVESFDKPFRQVPVRLRSGPEPVERQGPEPAEGLRAEGQGVALVADELLPRVYAELQSLARGKMAREQPGQTLQPTALVHEAWLRLGAGARFENRAHFFAAAAEAMRRILIERARRKLAARRGPGQERVDVDEIEIAAPTQQDDELLAVHEALDRLATHDARKAELVKLRYFAGLSFAETAEVLGISEATAYRDWEYARAWLHEEIGASGEGSRA